MDSINYNHRFGGYCECCDSMLTEENASPEYGLCIDCYADFIIGDQSESSVRNYLNYNRSDFISFLRGDLA